jgi:hypothetical protein
MENKQLAQGIASLGRYGDTTLMHMRPEEVNQLTAISRANGGDITINPKTGMPEAFLGDFLGSLLPMAAGAAANYFVPGSGFMAKYATPFIAGATTKAIQGDTDLGSLVMGGLGGVGGAGLGRSIQNFGNPDLAGTAANVADDAALDQVTSKGLEAGTDMTKAYATNVPQMSGTQGISMYTPQGQTFGATGNVTQNLQPNQFRVGEGFQARNVYDQGLAPSFTPERISTPGGYDPFAGGFEPTTAVEPQGFLTNATDNIKSGIRSVTDTLGETAKKSSENYRKAFDRLSEEGIGRYLSEVGDGDKFIGGIKTALPFAGAGLEAYQKGVYENMPTYEASTAGRYDPTRRLNLGMDTGLRLLAKGGRVAFEEGGVVRDRSYYGIEPQYNTTGATYSPIMGMQGGRQTRAPVQGFVDVGGKFVADPKGTMTDVDYENRFKYVTEGVAKPGDQSGGDFEARAGIQGDAGGINPAVALQAAQGYAESQQSNLDEQGLGTLKTGGSVRRFQMGGTTAERNMYGSQDTNEPTGLGTLTTAEQNLPGRMGMAGRTDLQNATTAEQNIAREPMQEAGTVVSSPMQNTMGAQPNDMASRLPMGPTDMNANVTESLGQALQSNPQGFTVIPNQSIPPTSGEAPMMAMGGRVRYAEGGISALTPDDGKMLNGNGDGVSDDIPAMIEGEQEAALSDGEFIVPARIVSELGNGSSDAGAKKLYAMIDRIQAARQQTMGDSKQYAKDTNAERFLPA